MYNNHVTQCRYNSNCTVNELILDKEINAYSTLQLPQMQ